MKDEEITAVGTPREGTPIMGVFPNDDYGFVRLDEGARVLAVLSDEQVERIALRVVELLFERNRAGGQR